MNRSHVVLLGAGASKAAFPNGERNGRALPLMKELASSSGIDPILDRAGITEGRDDFEKLFSRLHASDKHSKLLREIESALFDYFSGMLLPDEPTMYDHLVLSLREKDVIATFNWDPLLWQALNRCNDRLEMPIGLPRVLFLHGNTAIGYTEYAGQIIEGTRGRKCRKNGVFFEPGPLLYPVTQKNYQQHACIHRAWDDLKTLLGNAFIFTVFGYSVPETDVEAVELLQQGWGDRHERDLEEIEIIDIRPDNEIRKPWKQFIHSHHDHIMDSFYKSSIAESPRRSCEAIFDQVLNRKPVIPSPLPCSAVWDELIAAVRCLAVAELPEDPAFVSGDWK